MITIDHLSKSFGNHTVVDIPLLQVNKGEVLGLIGNNGAGKTTTLRLILDLLKADSGSVLINNTDVSKDEAWKEYSGAFLDNNFLIDFFTPEEYFTFIGKLHKMSGEDIKKSLHKYEKFMNGEILNHKKYIRHFSSGNKQKIGIIGAMISNPDLLILDEPFNFLDPSSQIEMKHLLQSLSTQIGTTIVISSHNLNYIYDVSTRILLLEKGHIIRDVVNKDSEDISKLYQYFSN